LVELKKLKAEGTLDEQINGYEYWTLGLYFFSQESVHKYNTFYFNIIEGDIYFKSNLYILSERLIEMYKSITDKTCKEEGFTRDKIIKRIKQNKYIFVKFDMYIAFNIRKILDDMPKDIFEFLRGYMCLKCIEEERENLFIDKCKWHNPPVVGVVIDNVLRIVSDSST